MCFCASASFFLGTILLTIGITALFMVHDAQKKRWRMLAAIPFIFGLQQYAEGVVWIASSNQQLHYLMLPASYVFLVCAFVIWPIWIPLSLMKIQSDAKRKKVFSFLIFLGFFISALLLLQLMLSNVEAFTKAGHVYYKISPTYAFSCFIAQAAETKLGLISCIIIYSLTVVMPFMISTVQSMWILGTTFALSCIATYMILTTFFISIWCFFAAAISIFIIYFVGQLKK